MIVKRAFTLELQSNEYYRTRPIIKVTGRQGMPSVVTQVIASEGEQKSAKALMEAAKIMASSPSALQLR